MTKQDEQIIFISHNKEFQLLVNAENVKRLLSLCKKAKNRETGGIIIGYYNDSHDHAIVTKIVGAPTDSYKGKYTFIRGVKGLKEYLDKMWLNKLYYLGEWHFHPYASPEPSSQDIKQMIGFSKFDKLHCPEPILLIIGGDPYDKWEMKAFVFPKDKKHIHLEPNFSSSLTFSSAN